MTTNGGISWVSQLENVSRVFEIYFFNDQVGWACSGSKFYRTTNGGNTWNLHAEEPLVANIQSIFFTTPDSGWAGGSSALLRTTNGGSNWQPIYPTGLHLNMHDIHFVNAMEGWAVGETGGINPPLIFKTSDGGEIWTAQSHPTFSFPFVRSIFMVDRNRGWVVGVATGGGFVLHTTNGGDSWELVEFPTALGLNHVRFANERKGWILGDAGIILHTQTGGVVPVEDSLAANPILPALNGLAQNFPNPFNSTTTMVYALNLPARTPSGFTGQAGSRESVRLGEPSARRVELRVYDVLGREVAVLVNEEKAPGTYEAVWDASGQASGVYFYRLLTSNFVETKKLVVIR
jgi:photosystem II stability/assembly factor-like uncharacterized protein